MTTTLLIQTEQASFPVVLPTLASMSRDEFYAFCQANRDLRIERTATGEIVVMPPAYSDHGNRNLRLMGYFWGWVENDGTGLVFDASTGFTLPNGAVRSPDMAWLRRGKWDRLTEAAKASFAPTCPDFVLELCSPGDSLNLVQAKMEEYIENGVSLGWLIDRKNRTVHIYRPDQTPQILEDPTSVSGDPELPGFSLPMAKIW